MKRYSLTETVQNNLSKIPNGKLTGILQISEHSLRF
ncbi:Uncharacterised protein [Bacillus tequilensis]|nr:Uncharacterised protein [Bacillus tequilensis]